MSFDYDPYKHIEVVQPEPGVYKLYCHSCGGEESMQGGELIWEIGEFTAAVTINHLFWQMAEHVYKSHGLARTYFEGWPYT